MNLKRTMIIVAVCAAAAAWFSSAMTPAGPTPVSQSVGSSPLDQRGAALASEIAKLRDRLRPDAAPREQLRNPFAFASAPRGMSSSGRPSAVSETAPAAPPPPVAPPLTLTGLAEDAGPDGPIRTAIISGAGQLFLVKTGEALTFRDVTYTVGEISSSGVDLSDAATGAVRRLDLK